MSENKEEQVKRNFGLSTLAVNNSTSIFILAAIITVVGFLTYVALPKEQYPEIALPTIYVNTPYPGNSPVDIENLITRPLEKEIKPIKGIKKVTSTSIQDVSVIIVEFNEDVDVKDALQDVKDKVDQAKGDLPSDLDNDPTVLELDFSEIPVVIINLSGEFEIDKLKEFAEYLEDEIEPLTEVSKVKISGAVDREIQINADPFKMSALKVTFGDIEQAIAEENMTQSGGDILTNGYRRSLRVDGEFNSVKEIESIIVKSEEVEPIYLRDVAEVVDSYVERDSYARLAKGGDELSNGSNPVVSVKVIKKSGENLIIADEKIREILERAKEEKFPSNLNIVLTDNQADDMKKQISNLENSIISGVILVVVVLLFFLGLRNAMFVGVAIPLSMLMGFLVIGLTGMTINIVVLFGLILALGMLVDNAIVVIENIYRLMEQGYPPVQAAKEGVGEVALAIISSTATTLAAFVPLAFWGGLMGEFMKYLPITLIIVLSSSLFVGLVINPVVAKAFMKVDNSPVQKNRVRFAIFGVILVVMGGILYFVRDNYTVPNLLMLLGLMGLANAFLLKPMAYWFQNVLLVKLEDWYKKTLRFALTGFRPYLFFFGTIIFLFLSMGMFIVSQPQTILFPDADPLYVYVFTEAPQGTDVKTTDAITKKVEAKVFELIEPYKHIVKSVVTNVGKETLPPNEQGGGSDITPNKSKISIGFVDYQKRGGINTFDIMKEISVTMKKYGQELGVTISTDKNQEGPPTGKPVNIEVTGEDYIQLIQEADKIKNIIQQSDIAGLDGLKMELAVGKPELLMSVDRAKARRYGLSTMMIVGNMRTSIFGKEVSKFKDGEDEYPINLRLQDEYRYQITNLQEQVITFRDNRGNFHQVPVSAIANLDMTSTFGEVKRKDLERMIAVSSNVLEGYNPNEIVAQITTLLSNHEMPDGIEFKFTGEQEEMAKSMAFLAKAMAIAVCAIFLILVSQFNSAAKPFIIVASVLFSLIGVLLGLSLFGDDFVIIMTGVGIISLAGVVVNNAIVLIDYTELTRKRMKKKHGVAEADHLSTSQFIECLVHAGYTRLRPVLLTAITTVLGLIPLATGLNIDFFGFFARFDADIFMGGENAAVWGPMAWTVIYGLVFATFLTLVIVPVMYLMVDNMTQWASRLTKRKEHV
ncbi:MAG: efflux RND transporter permease subunit [Flammeovirgaceae bacterium]